MSTGDSNYNNYGYSTSSYQNMPKYVQPVYDKSKITQYGQEYMAPGLAGLRDQASKFQTGYYRTPAEKAMASRNMLAGYGQGLGSLVSGGMKAGQGLYSQEYSGLETQAKADWQTSMDRWNAWNAEHARQKALKDPRGEPPWGFSSWAEADAAKQRSTPSGWTYPGSVHTGNSGGLSSQPGSPAQPTGTIYGAGSYEAYKQAMADAELLKGLSNWDLGGGRTGTDLMGASGQYNPWGA